MPGTAARRTFRSRISSAVLCAGVLGAGLANPVAAQQDTTIRSHSTRPPVRPQQQISEGHRRLVSPMGSATGTPPGHYQQHLGWNGPPLEYPPVLTPALPFVMYVGQPLFPAPAPEPAPVVVYNQVTVNNPPPVERVVVREEPAPRPRVEPELPRAPKPTAPQKVVFEIQPSDAQVKLDGRKLGTGAELGARSEPFQLTPGVYILQVEHPTYKSQRLVFGVSAELVRVEVDLTSEEPSLRARVR